MISTPQEHHSLRRNLLTICKREAVRVCAKRPLRNQPWAPAEALFQRWMLAFRPWEFHPSFGHSTGMQNRIFQQRREMIMKLAAHFKKEPKILDVTHYL